MSDQSLIEFEKWWKENGKHEGKGYAIVKEYSLCKEVWEAACGYKQAEIDELKNEVKQTSHGISVTKFSKEVVKKAIEKIMLKRGRK